MFHKKATTYEQMEKSKKDKKFKQNAYEEIRKLVDNNEVDETVKEVKGKKKHIIKKIHIILNYLIKSKFNLYLIKLSMLFYI